MLLRAGCVANFEGLRKCFAKYQRSDRSELRAFASIQRNLHCATCATIASLRLYKKPRKQIIFARLSFFAALVSQFDLELGLDLGVRNL